MSMLCEISCRSCHNAEMSLSNLGVIINVTISASRAHQERPRILYDSMPDFICAGAIYRCEDREATRLRLVRRELPAGVI